MQGSKNLEQVSLTICNSMESLVVVVGLSGVKQLKQKKGLQIWISYIEQELIL